MTRPSLQWGRDRKYDLSITTSDYERNKRDRDAIFAALRTHLLRPETHAKAVVDLLRRHFLESSAFTISDLTQSERAVLIEILHKVLDECSQCESAKLSHYVSPARIMAFYARYRILDFQDWAFCLNSLAWTAYEALFSVLDKDIDQHLQRKSDTFLLLRQLLKVWKLFFYCHSREAHELYEVLREDHPGLWPLLQHRSLPTVLRDHSSKYSLRLLAFAPRWSSDGDSFADQQLVCASMMSIAALSRSVEASTGTTILHPSTVIDWGMSTISARRSSDGRDSTADSAEWSQAAAEPERAPSRLSSDELSMLFVVGHALNSQSVNLTLLKVVLARLVPESRIGHIMTDFSQFRSRAPDFLGYTTLDEKNSLDLTTPDRGVHLLPTPLTTERSAHDPVDLLVQKVNVSKTTSEVESLRHTYSSLKKGNPRLKLWDFEIAVYQKYWELGSSDQEREVWSASPMIHIYKELWSSRLDFYFQKNDIESFEDVWARLTAASHKVTAADWRMKLQLHFNCGRLCAALEHFDALVRFSGISQQNILPGTTSAGSETLITVDTFNLMIKNLLENDKLRSAMSVKQRLEGMQHIQANDTTFNLFFSYWIDRGSAQQARKWLKRFTEASPSIEFDSYFRLIRHGLQQWPRAAPWSDVHLVMETFDKVFGLKYFQYQTLRRISLVPDADGRCYTIKVSPAPDFDTLNIETENGVADELAGTVPMRADAPVSPAAKAFYIDLVSLTSAIAGEYPDPKKARLMLILWTYCVLQGFPVLQNLDEFLRWKMCQLPFQQQLRLLGGHIYQRPSSTRYRNFAYVRTHFGPDFAVRRLEGLGLGRYGPLIRKLPWHGFTSYNDQLLLQSGVTSARARTLFLDDMRALHHNLETIRNEEQARSPKRMATEEGIWYLSDASVDNSGSLRKIPFEYWEPESKRKATQRFKLTAAVPKLLGGEEGLRRFKQQMIGKGRKRLTSGRKGLIVRPLRDQLLRRRRRNDNPENS